MVHNSQNGSEPSVDLLLLNLYTMPHDLPVRFQGISCGRQICVSLVGSEGIAILTTSSFDTNLSQGSIILRQSPSTCNTQNESSNGFWGSHGVNHLPNNSKQRWIHESKTNADQHSKWRKKSNLENQTTTSSILINSNTIPSSEHCELGVLPTQKDSSKIKVTSRRWYSQCNHHPKLCSDPKKWRKISITTIGVCKRKFSLPIMSR